MCLQRACRFFIREGGNGVSLLKAYVVLRFVLGFHVLQEEERWRAALDVHMEQGIE